MGKIKQGILGSVSGKVGGVIGGSWKGIGYVRSIPASVADRKSTAQLEQRGKMKLLGQLASVMLAEVVKPLWDRFAIKMSGYNEFVRTNMPAIVSDVELDLTKIVTSKGKMAGVVAPAAVWHGGNEALEISWSQDLPDAFSAPTDKIYIAVIGKTGTVFATSSGTVNRAAGVDVLVIQDQDFILADTRVFVSAIRVDGTIVSNSVSTVPVV